MTKHDKPIRATTHPHTLQANEGEGKSSVAATSIGRAGDIADATTHAAAKSMTTGAATLIDTLNAAQTAFAAMMPGNAMGFPDAGSAWMQWSGAMAEQMTSAAASEMSIAAESMKAMTSCRTPVDLIAMQSTLASAWFARAMSQSIALGALAMAPMQRAATANPSRLG